jgi:hypothetical protein
MLDDGKTLEILRVCTDGTKNANSFLYDKCRKIAPLLGYTKVITYTLKSESGSSLFAIGAVTEAETKPQEWTRPSRARKTQDVYKQPKQLWQLPLLS